MLGLSSVVLILDPATDVMTSRQMVQERLSRAAATLPAVARPPVMLSPLSSLSRVMKIGLTSDDALAGRDDHAGEVDDPSAADGDPRRRERRHLGPARSPDPGARRSRPAAGARRDRRRCREGDGRGGLAAGGRLPRHAESAARHHARRRRCSAPAISKRIVVASRNGATLRIGDVATVVEGFPPPIGDAVINNGPGLLLIVEKQLGANTLQVTRDVEAALEDLDPALAGVAVDPAIFRPATFIEMSLRNLTRALLIGCVLVILVLLVFLADWRTALISSTAIPLSLLAAGLLLHYRGGTLDTMVLAGLVIALGEVVDDAIIDVENIVRRLRLNRAAGQSAVRRSASCSTRRWKCGAPSSTAA